MVQITQDLSHRELCHLASKWLLSQPTTQLVSWELRYKRSVFDVIGLSLKKAKRITVIEVKRTRADLLKDLGEGKMLKYEQTASHCYLACAPGVLPVDPLSWLLGKGLPSHWGVLVIDSKVQVLRGARSIQTPVKQTHEALLKRMARQHMYRVMTQLGLVEPY